MSEEIRPHIKAVLPARWLNLPVHRGFPLPRFVKMVNGEPDFRIVDMDWMGECISRKKCWQCGDPLGRFHAYVAGTMCMVNLTSAEPPSHLECAEFAVKACPFLSNPEARRRDLPPDAKPLPGISNPRNPAVSIIWTSKPNTDRPFRVGNGVLFNMGALHRVTFWQEGRPATRAEAILSLETGLPSLQALCEQDVNPKDSRAALDNWAARAMALIPPDPTVGITGQKEAVGG